MPDPSRGTPNFALRPNRLGGVAQVTITLLIAASVVSGILIWRGKHLQLAEGITPGWLHGMIILHGVLNPLLCILFGYLLCQHIRIGWQKRANIVSGFVLEAVFATQILTGAGLYYAGSEAWRDNLGLAHRIVGALMPACLALHWIAGLAWARKQERAANPQ